MFVMISAGIVDILTVNSDGNKQILGNICCQNGLPHAGIRGSFEIIILNSPANCEFFIIVKSRVEDLHQPVIMWLDAWFGQNHSQIWLRTVAG